MHALPFSVKRAHFVSLKVLRDFTSPEQLTPARFDLLYVLHTSRYRRPFQYRVAEWLGVSRPTVCKMIRALRILGIVELFIDSDDPHRRRIALTRHGRKCFARALKSIRRGRVAAAVRKAWAAAGLSRREVTYTISEIVVGIRRYCRGLDERTELYECE